MPRPSAKGSEKKRKDGRRETQIEKTKKGYSAVLSDREIKKAYKRGDIVIEPYRREQVKPNSYDVRLGVFFYRQNLPSRRPVNIYASESQLWGPPKRAATLREHIKTRLLMSPHHVAMTQAGGMVITPMPMIAGPPSDYEIECVARDEYENIGLDDPVIVLEPGETILGHTEEFIGGVEGVTTMIKTRSSLGRNNIGICKCAGWGDTGFTNRWTLEITNFSRDRPIMLVCGRRVGQIVFMGTGRVSQKYDSKYQGSSSSLKKMMKQWKPEQMLPRLHLDEECVVKAEK